MKIGSDCFVIDVTFGWTLSITDISIVTGKVISFDSKSVVVRRKWGWFKWLTVYPRNMVFENEDKLIQRLCGENPASLPPATTGDYSI